MVFALVDAFCAVCKKSHWCCILGGLGMWGLSFILFLTLIINLIQVIIVKETYEAVDACLILDYTNERQTCSGSGCHYLYRPILIVQFSIKCSSGPNCTDGQQVVKAKAYEDPDEQWYTTPDALDLYYKHYPIGTTHSCFYEKNNVDQAVMTNNARFLVVSTLLRFFLMIGFIVVGGGVAFFGYKRFRKKQVKAEMKELKKSGKLGKAQAKYGTFQKKKEMKKKGKEKVGKVGKVKKLGKMMLEVA